MPNTVSGFSRQFTTGLLFVLIQTCTLALLFSAFAAGPQFVFAESSPLPIFYQGVQSVLLAGWADNNDGRLRLVLVNNSPQPFRGTCRISLGGESDQKEVGQIALALPPQQTTLLQLSNVAPSGQQYTLAIYDQQGARRFFKIAPLRPVSDPTPAISVAVTPIQSPQKRTNAPLLAVNNSSPTASATSDLDEVLRAASQVQVQARLLASEEDKDSFILSLEFRSARPVKDARIAIVAGKVKDNKPVSIYSQSHVEFKLPEQLETEQINYTLTGKDGRVLAKGELDLQQLMSDGAVLVNDIRTDSSSYEPGENARITILLEGKSQHGCRLEVSAKDGQNQNIFRGQKIIAADDKADSPEFTVSIPASASDPVVFEFKIFDSETGLLLDSGEREIPTNNTKSPRRPGY